MTGRKIMQIKLLVSAAAIALAAAVGSAAAAVGSAAVNENFRTLDGISAFDSLAGIQANPLGTDETSLRSKPFQTRAYCSLISI